MLSPKPGTLRRVCKAKHRRNRLLFLKAASLHCAYLNQSRKLCKSKREASDRDAPSPTGLSCWTLCADLLYLVVAGQLSSIDDGVPRDVGSNARPERRKPFLHSHQRGTFLPLFLSPTAHPVRTVLRPCSFPVPQRFLAELGKESKTHLPDDCRVCVHGASCIGGARQGPTALLTAAAP